MNRIFFLIHFLENMRIAKGFGLGSLFGFIMEKTVYGRGFNKESIF